MGKAQCPVRPKALNQGCQDELGSLWSPHDAGGRVVRRRCSCAAPPLGGSAARRLATRQLSAVTCRSVPGAWLWAAGHGPSGGPRSGVRRAQCAGGPQRGGERHGVGDPGWKSRGSRAAVRPLTRETPEPRERAVRPVTAGASAHADPSPEW